MKMATAVTKAKITSPSPVQIAPGRDDYGALQWPTIDLRTTNRHAKHLAHLIDFAHSFADFVGATNSRGTNWDAKNVDLYSVSARHEAILYQWRHSWGTKWGTQIRKSYYLAVWSAQTRQNAREEEISAARARAALRAFPDDPAGPVEYLMGLRPKPASQKRGPLPELIGFKLVRVRPDEFGVEHFYSYFDGQTEYQLGVMSRETAYTSYADHSQAGLYLYLSPELCEPDNIATRVSSDDRLAILRVAGAGKRIRYDSIGKYAVSKLTPLKVERYL